ncbi:MAG TPA: threonine--tRNA ligase [Phycisphaerales bacterium]|nr:MAG: threonine--tRNA ligase [Planctomycetes bacterium GWC2_45_44]HBG79083.1 threonine--tRNA ligase [Phycisphaerales bacterium]HBR18915.1 threonine--tRNA ligase [Phycisphaerales bacterium]
MAQITLPDGKVLNVDDGLKAGQVVEKIGKRLAQDALAVKINGQLADLDTPVSGQIAFHVITNNSKEGLEIIRHSCAHVMAEAICSLWPKAELVYGPTIDDGFYYDIDFDEPIRPEDFAKIEKKMAEIIAANLPISRKEFSREQALLHVAGNKYKVDNINRAQGETISFYSHGQGFEDLCRGPHVPSTGKIGGFKIMSVAGAYWHGDATQKMLQRVYGTAWRNQKELDDYLTMLEEAKKRDHRVIGKQMDLFSFHDEGPGFAFFHPKGMVIWNAITDFWRSVHKKYDYQEIKTPIILNQQLWKLSGHWDNYKENMYFTTVDDVGYAIKPMNCPGGCLVYANKQHSYREFPIRNAELGLVHRHEASGVMHGLVRVRQFTQDDAHIFCTEDQIEDEIVGVINLIFEIYSAFGFENIRIELSTKPEKHIGSDEIWEVSTNALKRALERKEIKYQVNEGDGAFYGPKIDCHIQDCLKRSWQLGTIQLDFSMPKRFGLVYTAKDNTEKTPVMIHRAILGSFERFIGILIEHFGGEFPLWLAPEQMRILTISEKSNDYAQSLLAKLKAADLRCSLDTSDEKIGSKIMRAYTEKMPYMLVVGPKEAETDSVNVRIRGGKDPVMMKVDEFVALAKNKIAEKQRDLNL